MKLLLMIRERRRKNLPLAPLSMLEQRFCEEYIFDGNGRRSIMAAGYQCSSPDSAKAMAWKLLQQANVKNEISRLMAGEEPTR